MIDAQSLGIAAAPVVASGISPNARRLSLPGPRQRPTASPSVPLALRSLLGFRSGGEGGSGGGFRLISHPKTTNSHLKISRKIGKAMQGNASLLAPSPPAPLSLRPKSDCLRKNPLYFRLFCPL